MARGSSRRRKGSRRVVVNRNIEKPTSEKNLFFSLLDSLVQNGFIANKKLKNFKKKFNKYIDTYPNHLGLLQALEGYPKDRKLDEAFKLFLPAAINYLKEKILNALIEENERLKEIKDNLLFGIQTNNLALFENHLTLLSGTSAFSEDTRCKILELAFRFCLNYKKNKHFPSSAFSVKLIEENESLLSIKFSMCTNITEISKPLEGHLYDEQGNILHLLMDFFVPDVSKECAYLADYIITRDKLDCNLLLEKGTLTGVTPLYLMIKIRKIQLFKKAIQRLEYRVWDLVLNEHNLSHTFIPVEENGFELTISFNSKTLFFKKLFQCMVSEELMEESKKDYFMSILLPLFSIYKEKRPSFINAIGNACLEQEGDTVTLPMPIDRTIVCSSVPVSQLINMTGTPPLAILFATYDEKRDKTFLVELLKIYPDFLGSSYKMHGGLSLSIAFANRSLFNLLYSCYAEYMPKNEQNIEKELLSCFKEAKKTITPYHLAYFISYKNKLNLPKDKFQRHLLTEITWASFKDICQVFPEYINLHDNNIEPILFVLIEQVDIKRLNRFRNNEFVDWHIEYKGIRALEKVLEKGKIKLTKLFLDILFEKGSQPNFSFIKTLDGISLGIHISHFFENEIKYFISVPFGEFQEDFDLNLCNEYFARYTRLENSQLLSNIIHATDIMHAQNLLNTHDNYEVLRTNASDIVDIGFYSIDKKGKIPKGSKKKREEEKKSACQANLSNETQDIQATYVSFLKQDVLIGDCLVETRTPNVYVYCDELFWADKNPDMIEVIKTGNFHLRKSGYSIFATIKTEGSIPFETWAPMKFDTGRGDRVYCAQLKGEDVVDSLGHRCTVYLPCGYVPYGDHDQYENGGNIRFKVHFPKTEEIQPQKSFQ